MTLHAVHQIIIQYDFERNSTNMCLEHWFIPGIRGLKMVRVVIQWKRSRQKTIIRLLNMVKQSF